MIEADLVVKRLPQADLIVALDETGSIVEQGTFTQLNAPGSYVNSLKIILEEVQQGGAPSDAIAYSNASGPEPIPPKATIDESRKTGDIATYKYYIRALGGWIMLLWLLLVAVNAFFHGFSCKSLLRL
jgi:ATP-binding cassette, subfamily C (CFTR/MRP), member 1